MNECHGAHFSPRLGSVFNYLRELLIVWSHNNKICRPLCQKKGKKAASRVYLSPTCFMRSQPASVIRQQVARIRLNIYALVTVGTPNTLVRTEDCLVNTSVHNELRSTGMFQKL